MPRHRLVEQFLWQGMFEVRSEVSETEFCSAASSVPARRLPELAARAERYGWIAQAIECWARHAVEELDASSGGKAAWLTQVLAVDPVATHDKLYLIMGDHSAQIETFWQSGRPKGARNVAELIDRIIVSLPRQWGESDADLHGRAQEVIREYEVRILELEREFEGNA